MRSVNSVLKGNLSLDFYACIFFYPLTLWRVLVFEIFNYLRDIS
jgi:hypothetical protein